MTQYTITVQPNRRVWAGYFHNTKVQFSFYHTQKKRGVLTCQLYEGTLHNYQKTTQIMGGIAIDHEDIQWLKWYGFPSFTVTACPSKISRAKNKILSGVNRILIFGDSLSDKGTLHEYTYGYVVKNNLYYNGIFSNGNTWPALLARELRDQINVSNYAVAGSTAALNFDPPFYNIQGQFYIYKLNKFLKQWNIRGQQLAFIFIGANDYLPFKKSSQAEMHQDTNRVINSIQELINCLIDHGVTRFILMNQPNLGDTPTARKMGNTQNAEQISYMHNKKLKILHKKNKRQHPHFQFHLIDNTKQFALLIKQPKKFNKLYKTQITETKIACIDVPNTVKKNTSPNLYHCNTPLIPLHITHLRSAFLKKYGFCHNPENYAFWDTKHVTAPIQKALYEKIKKALNIKTQPVFIN